MTEIYDNIRAMREKKHLTQEDMADELNMSASGYAKIEQGKTKLFHEKLEQIADFFGVSVYQLMPSKGDVSISINDHNNLYYADNTTAIAVLEKTVQHKDEIITEKNNQIQVLKDEVSSLKRIIELLENK